MRLDSASAFALYTDIQVDEVNDEVLRKIEKSESKEEKEEIKTDHEIELGNVRSTRIDIGGRTSTGVIDVAKPFTDSSESTSASAAPSHGTQNVFFFNEIE